MEQSVHDERREAEDPQVVSALARLDDITDVSTAPTVLQDVYQRLSAVLSRDTRG